MTTLDLLRRCVCSKPAALAAVGCVALSVASADARPRSKRGMRPHRLLSPSSIVAKMDQGQLGAIERAWASSTKLGASGVNVRFACRSGESLKRVKLTSIEQTSGWATASGSSVERSYGNFAIASKSLVQSLCPKDREKTIEIDFSLEADAMCAKPGKADRLAKTRLKVKTEIRCDERIAHWVWTRTAAGKKTDSHYVGGVFIDDNRRERPLALCRSGSKVGWIQRSPGGDRCKMYAGGSLEPYVLDKKPELVWKPYNNSVAGAVNASGRSGETAYACRARVSAPRQAGKRPQDHLLMGKVNTSTGECWLQDHKFRNRKLRNFDILVTQ